MIPVDIAKKLYAALTGFWWALDDHERRYLLIMAAWFAVQLLAAFGQRVERERRLEFQRVLDERDVKHHQELHGLAAYLDQRLGEVARGRGNAAPA